MTEQNRPSEPHRDDAGAEHPQPEYLGPARQDSTAEPPGPHPGPAEPRPVGTPAAHGTPEHTSTLPPYQQPWAPVGTMQARPKPARPSTAMVAGLLAAALAVGGMAGVAGAAGVVAFDNSRDSTSSTATNSSVVDRQDTPATAGSVEQVAAEVLPSVVKINVRTVQGSGEGSGIVISSDGYILTNNHVVEGAGTNGRLTVSFNDGSTASATVVGTDSMTDLAVIKADGVGDLTPATFDTSGNLDVGEEVVAIGSPFGLEATVTSGIVSALNRPVSVSDAQRGTDTTYPAVQTDAAINPGNSGGPLVNMNGEVVGINSSIRTDSSLSGQGGSIGLGFAIPIDKVWPIVEQLRSGETATHARLGVSVSDASTNDGLVSGAHIQQVESGSAADRAGLRTGDVVTKVDDQPISGSESLVATIRGMRPGDKVTLTVVRGGDTRTVDVTLDSDEGTASS